MTVLKTLDTGKSKERLESNKEIVRKESVIFIQKKIVSKFGKTNLKIFFLLKMRIKLSLTVLNCLTNPEDSTVKL